MARRILPFLILACVASLGVVGGVNVAHVTTWKALWERFTRGSEDAQAITNFKISLLDYANNARIAAQRPMLLPDQELESWLQEELASGLTLDDLESIVRRVQKNWPRYMKINLSTASGPTLNQIRDNLHDYLRSTDPEMTHLTCVLRPMTGGISTQVLVVAGQRLRDFSPELLHRTQDTAFFNVCPHCQNSHITRAQRQQESISFECPSCRRIYAVIAADTRGRFHHVNQYLTGYQPPAVFPKGQSKVEQMFTIWAAVQKACSYVRDPGLKKEKTDRWQTALETQARGMGDCEDSAIFLADWLIARGFEARVALGKYGDIGGHAWCVVRLDNTEYLLESTSEGIPDFMHPPLASRIGSRYVPDVLFDRTNLYVRKAAQQPWSGGYWSESQWLRVDSGKHAPKTVAVSRQDAAPRRMPLLTAPAQSLQRDFLEGSKFAYHHRTDHRASPMIHLRQARPQSGSWQWPAAIPGSPGSGGSVDE